MSSLQQLAQIRCLLIAVHHTSLQKVYTMSIQGGPQTVSVNPVYNNIKQSFRISKCSFLIGSKLDFVHITTFIFFAQAQRKDAALDISDEVQFYNTVLCQICSELLPVKTAFNMTTQCPNHCDQSPLSLVNVPLDVEHDIVLTNSSVRHFRHTSVWYCVDRNEHIVKLFSPSDRSMTLVFLAYRHYKIPM